MTMAEQLSATNTTSLLGTPISCESDSEFSSGIVQVKNLQTRLSKSEILHKLEHTLGAKNISADQSKKMNFIEKDGVLAVAAR